MESPEKIRATLSEFLDQGRVHDVVTYLDDFEKEHGTLLIDDKLPSLYTFKGVALHNSQRVAEAAIAFKNGLKHFPNDTRSWINLGEAYTQEFQLNDAIAAFSRYRLLSITIVCAPVRSCIVC
jgi:tetratricopeptide (TPR) repeat protein